MYTPCFKLILFMLPFLISCGAEEFSNSDQEIEFTIHEGPYMGQSPPGNTAISFLWEIFHDTLRVLYQELYDNISNNVDLLKQYFDEENIIVAKKNCDLYK